MSASHFYPVTSIWSISNFTDTYDTIMIMIPTTSIHKILNILPISINPYLDNDLSTLFNLSTVKSLKYINLLETIYEDDVLCY